MNINVFEYTPITFFLDLEDKGLEFDIQEFIKCYYRFEPSSEDPTQAAYKFGSLIKSPSSPLSFRTIVKASTFKSNSMMKNVKIHDTFYRGSNLWLLKPIDFNRGRGIELFNTLDGLKSLLVNGNFSTEYVYWTIFLAGTVNNPVENVKMKRFVIQKYIESPLLINKRKFDIRVWVLIDQDLNLYFFK